MLYISSTTRHDIICNPRDPALDIWGKKQHYIDPTSHFQWLTSRHLSSFRCGSPSALQRILEFEKHPKSFKKIFLNLQYFELI